MMHSMEVAAQTQREQRHAQAEQDRLVRAVREARTQVREPARSPLRRLRVDLGRLASRIGAIA
jgi:hypothetical protein